MPDNPGVFSKDGPSAVAVESVGTGDHSIGVRGTGAGAGIEGKSEIWAVNGESHAGVGVRGLSNKGWGVSGESTDGGIGVRGTATNGWAVDGEATAGGVGVRGITTTGWGVDGEATAGGVGVRGITTTGWGVDGEATAGGVGVRGVTTTGWAVDGEATAGGVGVRGVTTKGWGVDGEATAGGIGVRGASKDGLAGLFEGDVTVNGTVHVAKDVVLTGGDCAEHFDATQDAVCEPGTVMTISIGGALDASSRAYDKKVAGVVSGAGSFRPAIILDKQLSNTGRPPVALNGKVYCKVDAEYAAIEIGDLLTTSDTLGHAMKASEPNRAFGAVVGKALQPLESGKGLIPILVALQ